MKKKRFIRTLFICIIVFLGLQIIMKSNKLSKKDNNILVENIISDDYIELEDLVSKNVIVIDINEDKIVMGRDYKEKIHPASMTKVMTAIIGIENNNLKDRALITQDIIDYCFNESLSVSGFEVGDKPKILDLLHGILLESGGESSISLAVHTSGSEEEFVYLMNKKAREIGMENTRFSNCTGITDRENYSTAEDIGKMFEYAIGNDIFREIIESKDYKAKGMDGVLSTKVIRNNLLMKRDMLDIDKNYIKYGKTGYTDAAGLCLVSLGEVNGKNYIVVTARADGNPYTPQYNLLDTDKIYKKLS